MGGGVSGGQENIELVARLNGWVDGTGVMISTLRVTDFYDTDIEMITRR